MTSAPTSPTIVSGPASPGQERLWLAEQLAPGTVVYSSVRAWELRGPLDVAALRTAVDLLVRRHAALRTTLHPTGTGLEQRIQPPRSVPLRHVAATGDDEAAVPRAVQDLLREPFDLSTDLMFRAILANTGPDRHLFVMNVHHSACDGWSFAVIRDDLVAGYEAAAAGREPTLPEPGAGYLEHARRERDRSAVRDNGTAASVSVVPPARRSPLSVGRRRDFATTAGILRVPLRPAAVDRLRDRTARVGVTANMGLLAVFAVALSRWFGEDRVAFVTPVGARLEPEFERTVGFFVTSLPMVVDVGGDPSFDELLGAVRGVVLAAIDNVSSPAEQAWSASSDSRSGVAARRHEVSFAVDHVASARFRCGDLDVAERFAHPGDTIFDIAVRVELGDGEAWLTAEYDADALGEDVVTRFVAHFQELVEQAGDVDRVARFARVPAVDRRSLAAWSVGPSHDAQDLLTRVAGHARARPATVAVRDRTVALTYRELWAAAQDVARQVRAAGVRVDDLAATCLSRSARLPVAVLGVLLAGAAFVPLDPRDPVHRRQRLLARCGAGALLVDRAELAAGWSGPVIVVDELVTRPTDEEARVPATGPDNLAYVIHTSGSTGEPKGVMVNHRGLANYLRWATTEYGVGPAATVPLHTSVAFDMAVTSLLGPLYAGGCVRVLSEAAGPLAVADEPHGYQMLKGTPTQLRALLDRTVLTVPANRPSVIVLGGESWPAGHARDMRDLLPETVLVNEYGPTETVVGCTWFTVEAPPSGDVVPIGRPITGVTAHVVDSYLDQVPIGVCGELVVGGVGVARGYVAAPALTASRFVPDPFGADGGRLYRTGDLARWTEDGVLELVGRMDDQVKIVGYRVEPGEVEVVLGGVPGVREAAVVAVRRDDGWTELVGYVRLAGDPDDPAPARIRAHLADRLPAHMVPAELVVLERMPTNANGKLDRSALPEPPAGPPGVARAAAEPASGWSDVVHSAWAEVLGVSRVARSVSFFEAGGSSLLLLRLDAALRARGVFGLSVADLFRYPTIDALASRVAGQEPADADAGEREFRRASARRGRIERARIRRGTEGT